MGAGTKAIVESAREVCGSVRVGGKTQSVWSNDEIKAAINRKEAAWKGVLPASEEETKEICVEAYREEKRKIKRCIIKSKKKVNEQLERKMNEDMKENRKLFWKEFSNAKGRRVESYSRIKDGNLKLAQGEDEVRKIWKEYFEDLYNIDTQEEDAVHMCGFDMIQRGNYAYFRGEPIGRADVEVRVPKLKNGKVAGKDEVTGEIIKGGDDRVVDWIWRLCNIVFESGVVSEDWRSAAIVPLYKSIGERIE